MGIGENNRPGTGGYFFAALFIGIGLLLAACGIFRFFQTRTFKNPVAYAELGEHVFVVEQGDRVLHLLCEDGRRLMLKKEHEVEQDDEQYFYFVRGLMSCDDGVMVRSYIYDRITRKFLGHRYRKYNRQGEAQDIFTTYFRQPDNYPELYYTHGADGGHWFVNGSVGEPCILKIPDAGGVVMKDGVIPPGVTAIGETNQTVNGWQAIAQAPDGTIYLSSSSRGIIVSYAAAGTRLPDMGRPGFEAGELLAPRDLMRLSFGQDPERYLTVASQGNRSWVQLDATGRIVRTVSPLAMGYPYPDVLTGPAVQGPAGSWHTFDLVNKAYVILDGDGFHALDRYTVREPVQALLFLLSAVPVISLGLFCLRRRFAIRVHFPYWAKLLAFFIPLAVMVVLVTGQRVEHVFRRDNQNEYLLRLANLARAVVNCVPSERLERLCNPTDRDSTEYEAIYDQVTRIVDRAHVDGTPKWIIHKIRDGKYYFGINIWRGALYEPYIVPSDRRMFFDVLEQKAPQYGRYFDEQGEWFSYLFPITNAQGRADHVIELYRVAEEMDRAGDAARAQMLRILSVVILVTVVLVFLFARILVRPLERLTQAVHSVSRGDFEHRVDVRSRDEIGELSHDFNQMTRELKAYMEDLKTTTAAKERMEGDIRLAREVQQGIIPKVFPPFPDLPGIEIYARIDPAREVGGDFYDFFEVDAHHFGVVVADVSGKGVPAGLFMMVARTVLRGNARFRLDTAETLTWVNRLLSTDNPSLMFVTMFYMICDTRTGHVRYCNAGHNAPFLLRHGEHGICAEPLPDAPNVVIGVEFNAAFTEQTFELAPGDGIAIYTDGVTEPINPDEQMYGEERLRLALERNGLSHLQTTCDAIYNEVCAYQQGLEQFDDFTLLLFRYLRGEETADNTKENA